MRSPRRSASSLSCRVPSCPSQESICASLNVAAGHSRQGHLRVSDAGGSRRSYRNGRAKFCSCRGHPLSRGAPKVVGGGGFLAGTCHPAHVLASSRGSLSVLRDFRPGLSSTSRGSGVTKPQPSSHGHSLRLVPWRYTVTLVLRFGLSDLVLEKGIGQSILNVEALPDRRSLGSQTSTVFSLWRSLWVAL